ncbi:MAG TPA: helix-turn-helix domain-containing protein [bacterium]|nr:helix-turn-helix domain-containing protein [bacterium]
MWITFGNLNLTIVKLKVIVPVLNSHSNNLMASIPEKIKELREEAGMTLTQLAERSGLSLAYISKLESGGYQDLSLTSSKSLSKGLGLTLKDFLQRMGFLDNNRERPSLKLLAEALRSNGYSNELAEKVISYARFIKEHPGDK